MPGPQDDPFDSPVVPFPGWQRRIYRLSRPVTYEDILAFVGNEDLTTRETAGGTRVVIHKYGLVEINLIKGVGEAEVWFAPDKGGYPAEYFEALLGTRF
jgi:hypothetical protein